MPHSPKQRKIKLSDPATYRIDVMGHLAEKWSERLSGMRVMPCGCGCEPPITTLVGTVKDQAELLGLINNLYELHLPLVQVKFLEQG